MCAMDWPQLEPFPITGSASGVLLTRGNGYFMIKFIGEPLPLGRGYKPVIPACGGIIGLSQPQAL